MRRQLLSTLTLLSEAIDYPTLSALNPHKPPPPSKRGIQQLDASMLIRLQAAKTLVKIGPSAKGAIPTLLLTITTLEDRSPDVRIEAAHALWRIDRENQTPLAVQTLIGILEKEEEPADQALPSNALTNAAKYLGEIGPPASAALPVLRRISADASLLPNLRKAATKAVGRIGAKK